MDSLMNMELRSKLSNLGVNIPLAKIMEGPTIFELSETILNILRSTSPPASSMQAIPPSPAPISQVLTEQEEQEQKQLNEQQATVMKPSFIQEHFVKVYSESNNCNDCHLAGLLSFEYIDLDILQQALNQLIEREICLRTHFETHAVVVAPHLAPCKISFLDYTATHKDEEEAFSAICKRAEEDAKLPFQMNKAPLLRAQLYKYGGGWTVYTVVHHAVIDGVAMLVLWRSLFTTYHTIVEGRKTNIHSFVPRAISSNYKDYVDMEGKYVNSEKFMCDSSFWTQYLHNMEPLRLPSRAIDSDKRSFTACKYHFEIPTDLVNRLSTLINSHNLTMYHITIAAYMLTLSRICGDITIGTTISTRYHSPAWRDLLGNFINDVAMRVNFQMYNSKTQSPLALLHHVRTVHSSVMDHTSFPVYTLSKDLFPDSTLTRTPLYKAMFLFQSQTANNQINPDTLSLPSLSLQKSKCIEMLDLGESLFDLTMELMPSVRKGEGIEGDLIHASELFEKSSISTMVDTFLDILEDFACAGDEKAKDGKRKLRDQIEIGKKRRGEIL